MGAGLLSCGGDGRAVPADGRFQMSATECLNRVQAAGVTPVRWDAPVRRNCEIPVPLAVRQTGQVLFEPALRTSCPMLAAWVEFEPQMQIIARDELNSDIAAIDNFGSYSCRRMNGSGKMSVHATAQALDIGGFQTRDGRTIDVLADWDGGGGEERFLRAFTRAACRHFNLVLTPEADAAHADHLHLDIGPWRLCRD